MHVPQACQALLYIYTHLLYALPQEQDCYHYHHHHHHHNNNNNNNSHKLNINNDTIVDALLIHNYALEYADHLK